MRTWTTYIQDYQTFTDDSAANEEVGGIYINDSIRTVCNLQGGKLRFLEATKNMITVADQESYQIPNGFRKIIDMWIYSGSGSTTDTIYSPEMVFDPTKWKLVKQYRLGTGSVPYFTYVEDQTFKIQPIPDTTGNLITIRGRLQTRDLSIDDYTTGTIYQVPYTTTFTAIVAAGATSATLSSTWGFSTGVWMIKFSNDEQRIVTLTNGSAAVSWDGGLEEAATEVITVSSEQGGSIVIGVGTGFTASMVGRYLMMPVTNAASGGDGFWYEIAEVFNSTTLILTKEYEGLPVPGAAASFTIGQTSVIPEAYDIAPVYRSAALYWQDKGNKAKSEAFWRMYDGGNEAGLIDTYGGIIGQMLANEGETEEGTYIPPFASGSNTIMQAPYYFPFQLASGF